MSLASRMFSGLAVLAAVILTPMAVAPAVADNDRSYRTPSAHGGFGRVSGRPEIIVYRDRGFRGASAVIDGPADFRGSRFNDRISSIEVISGRWEVCADPDFRGRCEIIDFDEPELAAIRLNNTITSVRPLGRGVHTSRNHGGGLYGGRKHRDPVSYRRDGRGGAGLRGGDLRGAPVVLFADPDGRGRALPVYGPERHLNPLRFNDVVSSIGVRSGAWLVCSDPDFRGRCEVIDGYVSRTRQFGLNDNISSLRPVDYDGGRRGGRRW